MMAIGKVVLALNAPNLNWQVDFQLFCGDNGGLERVDFLTSPAGMGRSANLATCYKAISAPEVPTPPQRRTCP
jgi:hypothetical protein